MNVGAQDVFPRYVCVKDLERLCGGGKKLGNPIVLHVLGMIVIEKIGRVADFGVIRLGLVTLEHAISEYKNPKSRQTARQAHLGFPEEWHDPSETSQHRHAGGHGKGSEIHYFDVTSGLSGDTSLGNFQSLCCARGNHITIGVSYRGH